MNSIVVHVGGGGRIRRVRTAVQASRRSAGNQRLARDRVLRDAAAFGAAPENGLAAAFDAYRQTLGRRITDADYRATAGSGVFIAYAQTQRRKTSVDATQKQLAADNHAPEDYRVATVRNLDAWLRRIRRPPRAASVPRALGACAARPASKERCSVSRDGAACPVVRSVPHCPSPRRGDGAEHTSGCSEPDITGRLWFDGH